MKDRTGRYAIIGWGSLIWDLEILTPHVHGPWMMKQGPELPMEFSRISAKRLQALAVCLDTAHGVPCPTHLIASVRSDIRLAQQDLADRERAPLEHIGALCLETGFRNGRAEFAGLVQAWCAAEGWDGAVWTDLGSNFAALQDAHFAIPRAVAYLKTLSGDSLDEAVRYIESAPVATDTPLRRALAQDPWWQAQARRLRSASPDP